MDSDEANSAHSPRSQHESPPSLIMTPTATPTTTAPSPATIPEMSPKPKESVSPSSKKRSATTVEPHGAVKATKRRAARACVSCRARKVRCDVVEGAPCGNCRWDGVDCVVQESRRRKKSLFDTTSQLTEAQSLKAKEPNSATASIQSQLHPVESSPPESHTNDPGLSRHSSVEVPITHHQNQRSKLHSHPVVQPNNQGSRYPPILPQLFPPNSIPNSNAGPAAGADIEASKASQFLNSPEEPDFRSQKHNFLRPLPPKFAPEDVAYLRAKGALSVPSLSLQKALLRAYVEYVHPYNPLLDIHDFLRIVDAHDGSCGQISLFLYQAVMFSATAFVSNKAINEAGYESRKAARKAFFSRARLLYDFDYESDRLLLVQGLLLMTYWYETPDDQKDTWHWMGVAISLGHTIGLHRNPANTNMPLKRQKLWKRIWWTCYMRDRLVALGMRRPTRIKTEDFDVPMLSEEDFDLEVLPDHIRAVGSDCELLRDLAMQRELAQMCVAKAKLSLSIGNMLKAQYSVLICTKTHPDNMINSTMMLLPNKQLDNMERIAQCDQALLNWVQSLPESCKYRPLSALDNQNKRRVLAVHRNLLHMVYFTTVSALHRPLFLPSSPRESHQTPSPVQQQVSRMRVYNSAAQITRMAAELNTLHLDKFLPTTSVTVILPAIIIHMIEMKNISPAVQAAAYKGFQQCMRVMDRLRGTYTAADYAVAFVLAAMRKGAQVAHTPPPPIFADENNEHIMSAEGLKAATMAQYAASRNYAMPTGLENMSTPPPEPLLFPSTAAEEEAEEPLAPVLKSDPTLSSAATQQELIASSDIMLSTFTNDTSHSNNNNVPNINPTFSTHSPPATDIMSPVSSSLSIQSSPTSGLELGGNNDTDTTFDWGPNIDFDQWLQFPPGEGAGMVGIDVGENEKLVALSQIEGSNADFGMWAL
ncbi:fungal-specific transcription factor domain-containing protein [Xylaria sp. CBS 124048]|nr:fungal-specific transcription factor domain-containing protein [Xylaria sp. CBS 124048]